MRTRLVNLRRCLWSMVGTFTLIAASTGRAQDVPPSPDVVVTGHGLGLPPGTPAYGSVTIGSDRLNGDASGRVEDVLLDVAGAQQFRRSDSRSANPSAQGITLRALGGNASSRALVLLDGVPIADPFFGYIPFTALSPERLAAVRITRGGGSGPFGAGAVAGTIELVSAGRAESPLVSGDASYGSFNSQQVAATVSPHVGAGYISLFGRFERSDGFDTTPADQRVAATVPARFRDGSVGLRAVAPIDAETELQANGLLFDDHRTLRFAGADSSSNGEDASLRLIHRGDWQVDALAYLQARNFTNKVVSATTFRVTLDQRDTPATGLGGKIEVRPPVGDDHVLRIGTDTRIALGRLYENAYNGATGALTTLRTAGGHESTSGVFIEDDWTLGRLVLTGGGRADRWTITRGFLRETTPAGQVTTNNAFADRRGTIATGRAGALFHAAAIDLRAAAYTGFRVPTLNELYRPFVVFPVTTLANANLGLERLKGAEIGLVLHPSASLAFDLTGFYNRLEGAIANLTIGPNLRQRGNVDAIIAKGIEAQLTWRRGTVMAQASYAHDDAQVEAPGAAFDGLVPAQSPRSAASATLSWAPRSGALVSATARYVARQFEDDLETDALRPATTLDAVARLPVAHRVAIEVRAENLTDTEVQTRNQGGSIDLGTPRTLWIGVRVGG